MLNQRMSNAQQRSRHVHVRAPAASAMNAALDAMMPCYMTADVAIVAAEYDAVIPMEVCHPPMAVNAQAPKQHAIIKTQAIEPMTIS